MLSEAKFPWKIVDDDEARRQGDYFTELVLAKTQCPRHANEDLLVLFWDIEHNLGLRIWRLERYCLQLTVRISY